MKAASILKGALALVLFGFLVIVILNLVPQRRDVQHPIPHETAASDPQFARTVSAIFEGSIQPGHAIDTLLNGDEIFPAMLEAISTAEDTINFLTYIYWSGDIAQRFATALAERAEAGVKVRVLLDWAGSIPFDQSLIDVMEAGGVTVHRFRPLKWYSINRVNNRTHRKLLIVDGEVGFTGGVGIGDQWQGNARNAEEWRDNHYRVRGPVVSKMQAAFAENWLEATNEILQGERFYPAQRSHGELQAQHVKSSPSGGSLSMHQMMLMLVAGADEHIRIGMGYFAPDEMMITQMINARARGVEIDILIPGEEIAVPLVRRASRHHWGRLLEAGINVHEYLPTNYHTKLVIIDDVWVSIGSANFDERSFRLNDESNLNVYDQQFAQRQIQDFTADLSHSREITLEHWQGRSFQDKFLDWAANLLRTQL